MTTALLQRAWPACLSALQLDRWMLGELKETESELVRAHLSGCERCARTQARGARWGSRSMALAWLSFCDAPPKGALRRVRDTRH